MGKSRDSNVPKDRLHIFIGKSMMGCVFQSYYYNLSLDDCFMRNGIFDISDINNQKNTNALSLNQMQQLTNSENELLNSLKNVNALEFLTDLKWRGFIENDSSSGFWQVKMEKLETALKSINLKEFENDYFAFLGEIKEIINIKNDK